MSVLLSTVTPFEHNPSTPAGEIERTAAAADHLLRLHGWRRQVARWGIIAMIALLFAAFTVSALHR